MNVPQPFLQSTVDIKVTGLSLWHLPLTSHATYYMTDGKTCDTVETVVIALHTNDGRTGWGEVCPIPHYLPAYARGVAPALQELAPVILGADPIGAEAATAKAEAYLPGHRYALSALDIAFWDLTGQVAGLPLYRLLGGLRSEKLPLYHSITCVEPDEMARMAKEAQAKGMTQFQAKLGAWGGWEADVERLIKVREAVGPGPIVYGDWNCGFRVLDAIRVGRAVSHLDVMLEQPCATTAECARVKDACGLPMKLDETAHDTASLLEGYHLGCMDAVAVKLSKFGGLTASRKARDLCVHLGAVMCVEDTWGSDIATAAALHLCASTPPRAVMNVCDLSGYVAPRVAPSAPARAEGHIVPPEGPGLGITIDRELLGKPDLELC
ncbi:MAG: mandelate racemase/muconate lactonizing enzyme family protein [Pseudomonadota bacterium]